MENCPVLLTKEKLEGFPYHYIIFCPKCGKRIEVSHNMISKHVACKHCRQCFVVPQDTATNPRINRCYYARLIVPQYAIV